MKKLFAILLLISFSVQLTGYHLFFHFRQADIKRTVREKLRHHVNGQSAEQFVFLAAEESKMIQWDGKGEFRFNGEMYDVIEKRIENGKVFIRCISDKKENELVKNYKNIINDDFAGSSKKRPSLLLKLIDTFYAPLSFSTANAGVDSKKLSWFTYQSPLLFSISEVLTPPPQFV